MFTQDAFGFTGTAGLEDRFGDLLGPAGVHVPDEFHRQHRGNRAPFGGDDRYVVRHRFDQREGLAFVLIIGREAKHIALGKELSFGFTVGETDKAHGNGQVGGAGFEAFLGGGVFEGAGNGEPVRTGSVGVEQGDGFEGVEETFLYATEAHEEDLVAIAGGAVSGWRQDTGFGQRVLHDSDAFGPEDFDVGGEFRGEYDREVGFAEQAAGNGAFEAGGDGFDPLAEADGVPVQNQLREEWPAQHHDDPVAVESAAFGGAGHVVKGHRAVAPAQVQGFGAGFEQRKYFAQLPAPDVGGGLGETQVDVEQFKALAGAAKFFEEEANHRALSVVGGWGLGKYEQFHCRLGKTLPLNRYCS